MSNEKYIGIFEKEEGVQAFFTTKYGAVDGTPGGTIFQNEDVFRELGLSDAFKVWPRQIHDVNIAVIRQDDVQRLQQDTSQPENGVVIPDTDGVLTDAKNVLLTSVHADCLPVYLYDNKKGVIGLVHAGWRGAVAGIVPQAIRRMINVLDAGLDNIQVYIGPGISKCCFEVGSEVPTQFLLEWGFSFAEPVEPAATGESQVTEDEPHAATGESQVTEDELPVVEDEPDKYMLDLKAAVKQQILNMGIPEEHIEVSTHCTCCEPELFCSYRRDGGTYKRMGAGICLR